MATATDIPTPQAPSAPDLPPGVFRTYEEAVAYGRHMARLAGGGLPVITHAPDGTVVVESIVRNPAPAASALATSTPVRPVARLDERGRLLPTTPEEKAARAAAAKELFAAWDKEVWDDDQIRRAEQVCKALGVPGYEDVVLDEDLPPAGES